MDIETPIHMTDWYPTLIKLAGAKAEQKLSIDGHDVWATLNGGPSTRDTFVLNLTPNGGAIRVGDWKLLVNGATATSEDENATETITAPQPKQKGTRQVGKDSVELFNLAEDPNEKRNRASEHPDKVKDLQARLATFAKQAVPPKSAPKPAGFVSPKVWGEFN